jgi:two-component system response regulator FixJ
MNERDATFCIVDDDYSVRSGLEWLLYSAGYRLETFASAREFLECEELDGLGCLVVDVRMQAVMSMAIFLVLSRSTCRARNSDMHGSYWPP